MFQAVSVQCVVAGETMPHTVNRTPQSCPFFYYIIINNPTIIVLFSCINFKNEMNKCSLFGSSV